MLRKQHIEEMDLIKIAEQAFATEAKEFPSFCEENCEDCQDCTSMLDMDFPLDSSLEESLINLTVEELVNTMLQIPQDRNNDGADDKTES